MDAWTNFNLATPFLEILLEILRIIDTATGRNLIVKEFEGNLPSVKQLAVEYQSRRW